MRRSLGLLLAMLLLAIAPTAGQENGVSKNTANQPNIANKPNAAKPLAEKPAPARSGVPARNLKNVPVVTPEREAAALAFVRQHHPEMADLLARLKTTKPREYERAAQELFRTSERLALSQERDPEKYELELETWKIDSQVRLLAARLMMADDPAKVEEMKRLIDQREELRLQVLLLERDRVANRAARLDASIEKARRSREQQVGVALQQVLNGINESRPKNKAARPKTDQP